MDACDFNFAHSLGLFASTSKTGEVVEARDYLITNSKAPIPDFNQGFLKKPDYKLTRTLDRVLDYYARSHVPFRLHVSSEHDSARAELLARGFIEKPSVPCMVLEGAIAEEPKRANQRSGDLTVRQVEDAQTLQCFQRVAFESFGFPVEVAALAITEDMAMLPHTELFVGYVDGEPACCSMLVITGDVAGIHWVGALAAHRKLGLGAAITAHAVRVGRARGCRSACLQASPMGAPVYARMGFATIKQYLRFEHS